MKQKDEAPGGQLVFVVSLTDGEAHCAAMGGLSRQVCEEQKLEI